MRSYMLPKREVQNILSKLIQTWPSNLLSSKIKEIKKVEINYQESLFIVENMVIVGVNEFLVPFLKNGEHFKAFPNIIVDLGAVQYICNGADIMRPGIVNFDRAFNKDDIVLVQEEKYRKYIAVGIALLNSVEAKGKDKGPVVKNLHHVGDSFWEVFKNI